MGEVARQGTLLDVDGASIEYYSDASLWRKLADYARAAGRLLVERVLTAYYALKDARTPAWAKAVITAGLAYFILPIDVIPDAVPISGYADDWGVIGAVFTAAGAHITAAHRFKARRKLLRWFRKPGA